MIVLTARITQHQGSMDINIKCRETLGSTEDQFPRSEEQQAIVVYMEEPQNVHTGKLSKFE